MKNKIKNLYLLLFTMLALGITSCSDNDDFPTDDDNGGNPNELDPSNWQGTIEEDLRLDATETYNLSGVISVEAGATLTIPAGTQIVADTDDDDDSSTNVYIVVQKGAKIDIQGTSSAPVIMSAASGNSGSWGGLIIAGNAVTTEGPDSVAEVGGIVYGGSNAEDNSGSINYLVIEDAGAQINSESQFNGLSLYAVGSGTKINNVAINNGADDGVEFFGGSVSATNLYLENNEDDAVDWTEGWDGGVENVYVLHTTENFSTAIEADGQNNMPTITNFTAVSTTGGIALQFKKQSGATINGLSLSGYDTTVDITETGRTDLSGIQIEGADADASLDYDAEATVDASMFDWIGNRAKVEVLPGTIDSDTSLDASTMYVINGVVSVENKATLTIPAGTHITARTDEDTNGTSVYIVVQRDAMIDIQGTADNPVVMNSTSGSSGSWGGLVIAGNAVSTDGINLIAEVGGIVYGGDDPTDNSGSISYLILSDAGAQINSESQYNGLSLYAVGSGTKIDNVAILNGADDGIEFFGGSVVATNLYLENNEDDAVDWTEGWDGGVENVYVSHTIENFSTAIEADGPNNMPTIKNFTAVSTTGGIALQFKKQSGAVIEGLSLSGYTTIIDLTEDGRTLTATDITIDGVVADLNAAYEADATVDVSIFDWAM